MKFLAFTSEDQGIIIEADDWQDAKLQLKNKIKKTSMFNEIKLLNLADGSEKRYMPMQKGGNVSQLYGIAKNMNTATNDLVEYIKNEEFNKDDASHRRVDEQKQDGGDQAHPNCNIM